MGVFSLQGHTSIVTGGASGIGLAASRLLAQLGANVVVADVNVEAGAKAAEELNADGSTAMFVRTDISRSSEVDALMGSVISRFGSLEILMHFAGIGVERLALETTREEWDRIIAVNLTGSFLVMQAAWRGNGRGGIRSNRVDVFRCRFAGWNRSGRVWCLEGWGRCHDSRHGPGVGQTRGNREHPCARTH